LRDAPPAIVLDTNVLSELAKPAPDRTVMAWTARQHRVDLYTTAISEAELAYGLAVLPRGRRRDELTKAVARLLNEGLGGRILAFDRVAATAYGEIAAGRSAVGHPIATADGQIAAIARARGVTLLATRGVNGLQGCGVPIIDPWQA